MPRANSKLRARRKTLGLKQTELAARAEVSRRTIQLAEKGENIRQETLEAIAESLCVNYGEVVDDQGVDAFEEPGTILRYVDSLIVPDQLALCHSAAEAEEAIRGMQQYWRDHLARCESEEGFESCANGCRELLRRGDSYYHRRYLSLWQKNHNVIAFATRQNIRVGASVILPVSDAAYENVRRGVWSFMDVKAEHILERSQNLIVDSGVEFSDHMHAGRWRSSWFRLTDALRFTVFYQLANLSHDAAADDFRVLSFGASPINAKRLQANGFESCGVRMPDFEFEVFEFANSSAGRIGEPGLRREIARFCVQLLRRLSPKQLSHSSKRLFIRSALYRYQQLLRRIRSSAA